MVKPLLHGQKYTMSLTHQQCLEGRLSSKVNMLTYSCIALTTFIVTHVAILYSNIEY